MGQTQFYLTRTQGLHLELFDRADCGMLESITKAREEKKKLKEVAVKEGLYTG